VLLLLLHELYSELDGLCGADLAADHHFQPLRPFDRSWPCLLPLLLRVSKLFGVKVINLLAHS